MRKYILALTLLLCGGFSLAAQSRPPEATIFVKPITGNGSKSDDNNFFYKQLLQEIISQDFNLATTQRGANFILNGSLDRYLLSETSYALHLELRDTKTGELKVDGDLLYETTEDARYNLPFLVSSLLYTIPPEIVPEEPYIYNDWRDKLLYMGIGAKWTPGSYKSNDGAKQSSIPAGFQGGLSLGFHFASFMSLETGVEAQFDGVNAKATSTSKEQPYFGLIIGAPLLLKICLKPGANSMVEPYIGPFFNFLTIPAGKITPYFITIETGLQYSFKAGPGALFIDAGFAMDLGASKVKVSTVKDVQYSRMNVHVGLGYKFGFVQRATE